jgi:hypothetical protein
MKLTNQARLELEKNIEELTNKLNTNKDLGNEALTTLLAHRLIVKYNEHEELKSIEDDEITDNESEDINGYFQSQKDFAYSIYEATLTNNKVIAKAPMQFGKTGTIHYLCNALLSKTLKKGENVIFMTSMSDTSLLIQNKINLQSKKFINDNGKKQHSNIIVVKMNPDFRDKAEEYIKEYNVKYVIFDECDYGSGDNSLFNKTFFNRMKKSHFDTIKLIAISATPYCALNAIYKGDLDATIVEAEIPKNYFGVTKMIEHGMIRDINDSDDDGTNQRYNIISRRDNGFNLSNEFINDLNWFKTQEGGGLAIVRAKNTEEAHFIKSLTTSYYKHSLEILSDITPNESFEAIAVGVKSTSIKEILGDDSTYLRNEIIYKDKKVLLVVVNALSAGKDLGDLKSYVRLVVETRKSAIANGSQGLIGRVCGYHKNRNIKMVGSLDVLRNYSELECDANVMKDSHFINETIELGLNFSTQLKKGKNSVSYVKYEQMVHGSFTVNDIFSENPKLKNLFPENNTTFGTWDELNRIIIHNKRTADGSTINSQRKSAYKKDKKIFDIIWNECVNNTINFGNRFHRFRAESNDESRLRIKRGIIFNDETGRFYIIDRLNDGELITEDATVSNKSCYIK